MFTAASVMISGLGMARHVHDEAMADAAGGADAGVARHDGAHQLVGMQAALHQGFGPSGAHQLDGLGGRVVAVLGVDQLEGARCRARPWRPPRGCAPGGPTRIGCEQAHAAPLPPRLRAKPRRRDERPRWPPAGACAATLISRSYFSCRVAAVATVRQRSVSFVDGRPGGGRTAPRSRSSRRRPSSGSAPLAARTSVTAFQPAARRSSSSGSSRGMARTARSSSRRSSRYWSRNIVLDLAEAAAALAGCRRRMACRTAKPRSSTRALRQPDIA